MGDDDPGTKGGAGGGGAAGAEGAPHARMRVSGRPQLDPGMFAGRLTDTGELPRVWAWCARSGAPSDFEYWMQMLPGHPTVAPYVPCGPGSVREYLRMQHLVLADPMNQPMNDARLQPDRDAFHRAVEDFYVQNGQQAGAVTAAHFRKFLAYDAAVPPSLQAPFIDPGANGVDRVLGDGVFAMYQISDPAQPTLPLGWGWIPPLSGAQQVWSMVADVPQNGGAPFWRRPGAMHPSLRIWIEFVMPTPVAWDIVNAPGAALVAFDSWIRQTWPHAAGLVLDVQHMRAADLP